MNKFVFVVLTLISLSNLIYGDAYIDRKHKTLLGQTRVDLVSHHHKNHDERKDFIPTSSLEAIPTSSFEAITNTYLRDHMPMLDDAQKRTRLREKEMNFYGTLMSDRGIPTKHSNLKEGDSSKKEMKKVLYGR